MLKLYQRERKKSLLSLKLRKRRPKLTKKPKKKPKKKQKLRRKRKENPRQKKEKPRNLNQPLLKILRINKKIIQV
jgi:hypothetical protein